MRKIPLTTKDFSWVNWKVKDIKGLSQKFINAKKKGYTALKKIPAGKRTFENTVYALTTIAGKEGDDFRKLSLLSEVSDNKEFRDESHKIISDLSQKLVDIEYDPGIYRALVEYRENFYNKEKKNLRPDDIKLFTEMIRDYRRMGFDLLKKKQNELKKLLKECTKLSHDFSKNINDYDDYITCTKEELEGLPERFINSLPKDKDGRYIVTLAYPHYFPFMAEAKNREKRKELAVKNLKKGGKQNLQLINKIVKLRAKISSILGYKHHADFKTENRMAKNARNVEIFQNNLIKKILPYAKKDIDKLNAFANKLGIEKIEHYDVAYVNTLLKKKLFDVDPETTRMYFPLPHVMKEMFELFETLFEVKISKLNIKLWHKDAEMYEVKDRKGLIGYFAIDLFPRPGKFTHAATFDTIVAREKEFQSEEYIAPFGTVICNFPAPHGKIPSLLSIGEVETLYHEFGHCLHMIFSTSRHEAQSGTNVAWDFVETPSQMMENFVWHDKELSKITKNYITGKPMPKELRKKILDGRKFMNAYFYIRQIIQGIVDLDLHTGKVKNPTKAYIELNKKYISLDLPQRETLFPAGFGHIVGYDAGYYSYLWALVYACDAFSLFEKDGVRSRKVGLRWRKEVLEKGSSEDEMKLIKNFLGREPSDKAFIREVMGK